MKPFLRYFTFVLATFSIFPFFSQTQAAQGITLSKPIQQLTFVFGQDWVANNPVMVTALQDCQENRITFKEEILTLSDKYPLLSSFPLMTKNNPNVTGVDFEHFDPQTFNPFTYNIEYLSDKTQVIRMDGTNWIMVVQPIKH